MNIPNQIKIGPHVYTIQFKEHLARDRSALGSSCNNGTWMEIDPSCPVSIQEETLIHEIIEQINSQHDLNLNHQTISTIANVLYLAIVDNPGLFK